MIGLNLGSWVGWDHMTISGPLIVRRGDMSHFQVGASNGLCVALQPSPTLSQGQETFLVPKWGQHGAEPAENHNRM